MIHWVIFAVLLYFSSFAHARSEDSAARTISLNGLRYSLSTMNKSQRFLSLPGEHHVIAQLHRAITPDERSKLLEQGIEFVQYVPENGYILRGDSFALRTLQDMDIVVGIMDYPEEGKLDASLRESYLGQMRPQSVNEGSIQVKVAFFPGTSFLEATRILQSHGVLLEAARSDFDFREVLNVVHIPVTQLKNLASEDRVYFISEIDPPPVVCNYDAQRTSYIDDIQSGGIAGYALDGTGVVVGIWDTGGLRITHEQVLNRATLGDYKVEPIFHINHVSGTIAGSGIGNASAEGMAPAAQVIGWDWTNDLSEVDQNAGRISVSNHSYRYSAGWEFNQETHAWHWYGNPKLSPQRSHIFGRYSSLTWSWDRLLYERNHLQVVAAGNERMYLTSPHDGVPYYLNDGPEMSVEPRQSDGAGNLGYNTISGFGTAKNSITVGAILDLKKGTPLKESHMTDFSSWGPTDDGRIKPDLVANGSRLLSTSHGGDKDYAMLSGTSMSAPVVTGTAALMVQLFRQKFLNVNPTPDMIKCLLIHSATDGETAPGPDYRFGWGLLNAKAAADFLNNYNQKGSGYLFNSYRDTPIEYSGFSEGKEPIRVTIAWTDPPANPILGGSNDSTSVLVNDLDLSVIGPGGVHYPWTLDPLNSSAHARQDRENHVDNVEQVYIATPLEGEYTIRIGGIVRQGNLQNFTTAVSGLDLNRPTSEITVFRPYNFYRLVGEQELQTFITSDNFISAVTVTVDGVLLNDSSTSKIEGLITFSQRPKRTVQVFTINGNLMRNGPHTIEITVRDGAGNQTVKTIPVYVFNEVDQNLKLDEEPLLGEIPFSSSDVLYPFRVSENGLYILETLSVEMGTDSLDSIIELYDNDNRKKLILSDDDSGIGLHAKVIAWLEEGREYIAKIKGFGGTTGFYRIQLRRLAEWPEREATELLVNNEAILENIEDPGEERWYHFTTPYIGSYQILLTPKVPDPVLVDLNLYDSNDLVNPLANGNYSGGDINDILKIMPAGRNFFLRVKSRKSTGKYDIQVITSSLQSPKILETRGPGRVGIASTGERVEDWYIVPVPKFSNYLFELYNFSEALSSDFSVTIYDLRGYTHVLSDKHRTNQRTLKFIIPLYEHEGYFVKIAYKNGSGAYQIRIQQLPENARYVLTRSFSSAGYRTKEPVTVYLTPVVLSDLEIQSVQIKEIPPEGWTFVDPALQEQLHKKGYVSFNTRPEQTVAYDILPPEQAFGCYTFWAEGQANIGGDLKTMGIYEIDICGSMFTGIEGWWLY